MYTIYTTYKDQQARLQQDLSTNKEHTYQTLK